MSRALNLSSGGSAADAARRLPAVSNEAKHRVLVCTRDGLSKGVNRARAVNSNEILARRFDPVQQLGVSFDRWELRELPLDVFRSAKQKTRVRFAQHRGIVEGIASRDDVIVELLERRDGPLFLLRNPNLVADNPVVDDFEAVTQQRRPFQLAQQRLGELLESVGKDDDLRERPQLAQEFQPALQGT